LLQDLDHLLGQRPLHSTLLLVVPSKSLRLHLVARILSHRKRGVLGLDCRTHHSLAHLIVERAGFHPGEGADLFPLFARRFAREEDSLRRCLEHLSAGYTSILPPVRDLLDAGIDPAHVEALEESLAVEGPPAASAAEIDRAQAVLRTAGETAGAMQRLGLTRSSSLMAEAAELVRDGLASIEVSAVLIYGFADATGVTTDFLQSLLEVFGGRLYLDRPPDPVSPDETDAGVVFSRRFSERMALSTVVDSSETQPPVKPKIEMYKAFGGEAEVREAARRIHELLGRGTIPESIGVVARDLAPYRSHVRTHFHRLGIPFSGVGSRGPKQPWGHRGTALLELLRRRETTTVERWLETLAPTALASPLFDLRLALHSLGAGRLQEAAELRLEDRLRDESL
jgi:hypothetical protein